MNEEDVSIDAPAWQNKDSTHSDALNSQSRQLQGTIRSCITCHNRKIRCDKECPCATCLRNNVICCYPEVEQVRRRPQRTTIIELAQRLARLERTISAMTKGAMTQSLDSKPVLDIAQSNETVLEQSPAPASSPEELLVRDGESSRYINEVILSRILDNERELQVVMRSSSSIKSEIPGSFSLGGIFHEFNISAQNDINYYPSRWQAQQLWQTFLNNVDPIMKILHIPTDQATIYTAINSPANTDPDVNALLFSIYFAATSSLSATNASNLLGQDKMKSLASFQKVLEQSLARANIFDSPSLKSLQATTLYIISLRAFNTGRSAWSLAGLCLRLAQSIGLHRDGSNLRLSPFESEMRRRLWWCLSAADTRAAEDLGIAVCNVYPGSDTRLPLNVDDSQLSPDMKDLPAPKLGSSEMTFTLIMIEIGQVLLQVNQSPPVSSYETRTQVLNDTRASIEERFLRYLDPNIPNQRVSSLFTPIILRKIEFVVEQQSAQRGGTESTRAIPNENTLISACMILEVNIQLQTDDLLEGFYWYIGSYTQYHLLTYLLWHLCMKPGGPNTERAWNALDCSFQLAEHRHCYANPGSKWKILHELRKKALLVKEAYDAGNKDDNSAPVLPKIGMEASHSHFAGAADDEFNGTWNWGGSQYTEFQDWSSVLDGFEMPAFNGL